MDKDAQKRAAAAANASAPITAGAPNAAAPLCADGLWAVVSMSRGYERR
jgi:hypothetical protein